MYDESYFAADDAEKTVEYLQGKSAEWFRQIQVNQYLEKIKKSWAAYHGTFYENAHGISYGGEQGELVNFPVNHYRNLGQHMLTMITSTRPSFQCRAVNTDRKSMIQAKLGNGLLDYYMREKRLERFLKEATEYAISMGSGYVKMEWNATKGDITGYVEPDPDIIEFYDEDEDKYYDIKGKEVRPEPIYQGDIDFSVLSPFDVVFDPTKESPEYHEWLICRSFINRHNLAAKYPEFEEEIMENSTKDNMEGRRLSITPYDATEDIPVFEFFHEKTEALPNGRHMIYLENGTVLSDGDLIYKKIPIYRIAPSNILGTPFGYTGMFDLLPLQDAANSLYSTILTNQNAFGVQNILNPQGNNIKVNQLEGGLNFLEYNAQVGKPEALQLTETPPEVFNFLQMIVKDMETVSGVNSVARGNPESSLKSGNALALIQSQALQFMSGLQQSYVQLLEDVGTGLINLLRDFAEVPRIVAITGISNTTKMQEFKSDDINLINRVVVDVGNALMQCLAKDTPVLMFDGSIKMSQDIRNGDLVMGPDSKPRTVSKAGTGFEEMFEVRTKSKKDEHIYTCNKSHIMSLKYCSDYKTHKKGDILDIPVAEYLELTEKEKSLLMGFRTGVEFETKEVPLDPYAFGLWLGDGNSDRLAITTNDVELETYWKTLACEMGYNFYTGIDNRNGVTRIGFAKTEGKCHSHILKELEVYKNKHVPHVYKYNSQENLLGLLAGFIDADGTLVDQTFVIEQKNNRTSEDIVFIARSLGFKVSHTKKKKNTNYTTKESETNLISIGGDTWRIPTKLERKQSKEVEKQKDWLNYGINLVSIGSDKYYGFTLEEEPHFLLGDFTVTHNTTAGRAEVAQNLLQMMPEKMTPEKYIEILYTGNLDSITDGVYNEMDTIKSENEALIKGENIVAIATDHHASHIREHRDVLADPVLRQDDELVQRTLNHIMEHINLMQTTDPNLLAIIGEQALAPAGGSPVAPDNVAPGQVPAGAPNPADIAANPQAQSVQAPQGNLPEPASPPAPFQNAPQTPEDLV